MKTKNILIGAGVLVVGYLAYKNMKNNQSKLAQCTAVFTGKNVEEEMARTMFKASANFDKNAYKKEAIDRCLQINKNK